MGGARVVDLATTELLYSFLAVYCTILFQDLEFTGVMRFYYQAQDLSSGQKVRHHKGTSERGFICIGTWLLHCYRIGTV